MHAVIRRYTASPEVVTTARERSASLEATMQEIQGFVAYYFVATSDGVTTITICDDQDGIQESLRRAAAWVRENLPAGSINAPEISDGEVVLSVTK